MFVHSLNLTLVCIIYFKVVRRVEIEGTFHLHRTLGLILLLIILYSTWARGTGEGEGSSEFQLSGKPNVTTDFVLHFSGPTYEENT